MNISSDTVAILKNFSDINQNILVKPGNQLQTISTLKNILAQADVSEKFDQEFAIYDLPEFLRAVDLFDKSDLAFNGGQNLTIKDSNSKQAIKYYFADKSVVVAPTKMIRDDYEVAISSQKISHFINRNKPIQYWIAIEPDSEF